MNRLRLTVTQFMASQFNAFNGPGAADPAPETPKEIADKLQKAIHDFQAANDERLDALEKGQNDGILNEKVERLNAVVDQAKEEMQALTRLAETNSMNVAQLQLGGPGHDVGERAAAAKFFNVANAGGRAPGAPVVRFAANDPNLNVESYREYKNAFEALIRNDGLVDNLHPDIRAALSVGSDRDGGYLVPTEVSDEMERRVHDTSPLRQHCRVISIGSSAWEAPYKSSKGVSGGWVGERDSRAATGTGAVGMQRIETQEQYAYPEVTQSMLDDAAINVEDYIVEDTEEQMVRTENTAFVTGNGVLKPRGFADYASAAVTTVDASRDWGVLQQIVTGAAAGIPTISGSTAADTGAFIDTIAALNPAYRQGAIWTMPRLVEATLRKLRDADGRYLVGVGGGIEDGLSFNLFGYPIVNLEDMAALAANSYSIAFGNFRRGYFIIDRLGFRILRDPYTNKPYVGFYITKRVGGDVRNFDAIKLVKTSA